MKVTRELFVIPRGSTYLLYAPLKGVVMEVNGALIGALKKVGDAPLDSRLEPLKQLGIIVEDEPALPKVEKQEFAPTHGTIMPTTDCNLRCVYCYGNAGIDPSTIDKKVADAAVDYLIENALKKKAKRIYISLHGGGEPLLKKNWDLVTSIVATAQEKTNARDLGLKVSAGTNGVLGQEQLEWIVKNLDYLTVSLDGPEDLQNKQRPTAGNGKSYDAVMRTIAYLAKNNFRFGIRATITEESVYRMTDLVDFFATFTRSAHVEPLSECGRCATSGAQAPDAGIFLTNLIKAIERGKERNFNVHYSGKRFGRVGRTFCGAAGTNFCVTQDGNVTACYEVTREKDPRSETFFFGKYENGHFTLDTQRLQHLASRSIENMPYCADCFAKFTCCGDCLAKVQRSGSLFDPSSNTRCRINRGIVEYDMAAILRGKNATA